jgi:vacuolar-type H+-ATPase subunit C/Vma6
LSGQIAKDPLGIGVVLGYLALKTAEVGHIRWIAYGISLGLPTERIRAEVSSGSPSVVARERDAR